MTVVPLIARQPQSDVALVLGGGNALGAYHAGACERLYAEGIEPGWIVGASVGAVTGAILAGNPPERRLERLHAFWKQAAQGGAPTDWATPHAGSTRSLYNTAHTATTLAIGRPGIFQRRFPGPWSILPWLPADVALYDHAPLAATLERLVDFDRLNHGGTRLSLVCTDLETGEEVWFDNRRDRLEPRHLLATSAIAPLFPPVEVDGRLLADPGYVNNLPLDRLFAEPPQRALLCFAVELFSLRHGRPGSLDAVVERTADILFASHARRAIAALRREHALRRQLDPGTPNVTLAHLAYRGPDHELGAKMLDFSPASVRDRSEAGRRDMDQVLAKLALGPDGNGAEPFWHLETDRPGPATPGPTLGPEHAADHQTQPTG